MAVGMHSSPHRNACMRERIFLCMDMRYNLERKCRVNLVPRQYATPEQNYQDLNIAILNNSN